MKKNILSTHKYLILGYVFGGQAVFLGLIILVFAEIGRGIADTVYQFRGFDRLFGLYPIAIGLLFIFAGRAKHAEYTNKDQQD